MVTVEACISEGDVTTEQSVQTTLAIVGNDRLVHRQLIVGTVHVTFQQVGPFLIAKLVESEQGMVAGAPEMAVEGRAFLLPVSRALRTIHIENQFFHPNSPIHLI